MSALSLKASAERAGHRYIETDDVAAVALKFGKRCAYDGLIDLIANASPLLGPEDTARRLPRIQALCLTATYCQD